MCLPKGRILGAVVGALVLGVFCPVSRGAEPPLIVGQTPFPVVQVIPLPYDQASFQLNGKELVRYHFGSGLRRPFWFPLVGPEGCSYTRMGHPHDPNGHSHHNSLWISHENVNGVNFWADTTTGRIVQQRIESYHDGPEAAAMAVINLWQTASGEPIVSEKRWMQVRPLREDEWLMSLRLEFTPVGNEPVVFGQSPFGVLGVRVAKTIGVKDGGGRILNSEGQLNEEDAFRQPARWVDYSGPVAPGKTGGITLMDHPTNPGHPTPFHLRNDGWMGPSLTLRGPVTVKPESPLILKYQIWVHAGTPDRQQVDNIWDQFAAP